MKILFVNRKDCFINRGGDTVQMEKTKAFLEKLYDVEINYCLSIDEILENNDAQIVHIFNIQNSNETLEYVNAAKEKNKKIILSSIYWDLLDTTYYVYMTYFNIYSLQLPLFIKLLIIKIFQIFIRFIPKYREKYREQLKSGLYMSQKHKKIGKEILNKVDFILPNSIEEGQLLEKYYDINLKDKIMVIPNAIEYKDLSDKQIPNSTVDRIPQNCILQVGRIEYLKNQFNVIRALYDEKHIPIVFVGKINPKLEKQIKELANKRGNVFFIDEVQHEDIMLVYKKAKVHVLASLRESPGLVSLEAKSQGCEIVVSDERYCPTKYYEFDKIAHICDPYNIKSIKKAILNAYNINKKTYLTKEYIQFFSYDNVAKMTMDVYRKVSKI